MLSPPKVGQLVVKGKVQDMMTCDVTCLVLNELDQRMLLIISWIGDQSIKNSFVYHFRSCRQSYIRKKLISISKMYVSSEKNFFYTNAICEQYLKLLVWAYAFKLISDS